MVTLFFFESSEGCDRNGGREFSGELKIAGQGDDKGCDGFSVALRPGILETGGRGGEPLHDARARHTTRWQGWV